MILLISLYGRESWSLVLSGENTRGLSVFGNVEMLEKMHSENFHNFIHMTNLITVMEDGIGGATSSYGRHEKCLYSLDRKPYTGETSPGT